MTKRNWFFIIGVYAMMFMIAIGTSTQGTLLSSYIDHYKLTSVSQGLMSTLQSTGQFAALFGIGLLTGRFRKSKLILVFDVAICALFFLLGQGAAFPVFLVFYFLYGFSIGFVDPLSSSLMVDYFGDRSVIFMNMLHGVYGVGGLIGPILASWCASRGLIWQSTLKVIGCLFIAASLLYMLGAYLNRDAERTALAAEKTKETGSGDSTWQDLKEFLSMKKTWLVLIGSFLYGGHQIGITVWIVRYIEVYLNSPKWAAVALSAFWVTTALSRFFVIRLPMSKFQMLIWGNLISGLAMAAGILLGNGFVMFLCTALCGLVEGVILPINLDISCHYIEKNTSLGSASVSCFLYIGFAVVPLIMAYVINAVSIAAGMMIPAVFSLVAAALCVILNREEKTTA